MKTLSFTFLSLFFASVCFADDAALIKARVMNAILCKEDSLDTVRDIVKKTPFNAEVASSSWGQEMDEKNVIILNEGITIAGSKASAVISDFGITYTNFQGIVFAEFSGDYKAAVKELGLLESKKTEEDIGEYVLPKPRGGKDEVCPPTIALTPIETGKFVLGCGWCNG